MLTLPLFRRPKPLGPTAGCALALLAVGLTSQPALALPMGFKDSWMFMAEASPHGYEATVNHAITHRDAVGLTTNRFEHEDRPHWWTAREILYVRKAHRWNLPDAQANFWLMGGVGAMESHSWGDKFSYSPGIQLDYETTRVYAGINARLFRSEGVKLDTIGAKFGVSFYEVDYTQLQPWFMVDLRRTRGLSDKVEVTPTLRFIHNRYFLEVGVNQSGEARASFMYLY